MPSSGTVSALTDASRDPSYLLGLLWEDRSDIDDPPIDWSAGALSGGYPRPTRAERSLAEFTTSTLDYADFGLVPTKPLRLAAQRSSSSFADQFKALRARLQLPVQKYALLLGTSRRTLYHWLDTNRPQDAAISRLERLSVWIDEIEHHVPKHELQRLFDPDFPESLGAILLTEGEDAALEQIRALTSPETVLLPSRRLDAVTEDLADSDVPSLAPGELATALAAFAAPRQAIPQAVYWEPPELTDSVYDEPA
jgi:hypothetical protein